ncbi:F-box/FBD/LRR-repeat protein [Citrus sinensis]|nr:F-box/FBD/LRR-repeat protein [Citrus sinensis]
MRRSTGSVPRIRRGRVLKKVPEDRISALPDSVLSNILTFLPLEDAVATSSLSQRWRHAWTSVRNLCFDDGGPMGAAADNPDLVDEFNNFIESVMAGTDPVSIHTFSLRSVNAIRRDRFPLWLPGCVYSSMTLEVLRLHTAFRFADPPDGVCFPQLKILQIYITHPENRVTEKLFCSCPSLTELSLTVLIQPDDPPANFIIQSTTLNTLTFVVLFASLRGMSYHHRAVIMAPNLQLIRIVDNMLMEYEVHEMQSIQQATLDLQHWESDTVDPQRARNLIEGVATTACLILSGGVLLALKRACERQSLSRFDNLTSLDVEVRRSGWKGLHTILTATYNLRTCILTKGDWFDVNDHALGWLETENVPHCLSERVTKIKMKAFTDGKDDVRLVEYFLWHSKVLDKFRYHCHGSVQGARLQTLCRKILNFRIQSPTVNIRVTRETLN